MTTPKNFIKNFKRREITEEMLGACIYSANKRAKNYRDKQANQRERRLSAYYYGGYYNDLYDVETRARPQKEAFYEKKENLLSVVDPDCIHVLKRYDDDGQVYKTEYFLYYRVGEYKFHSILSEDYVANYDLEKVEIDSLVTEGREIKDLISSQFVDKIIELIKSGDYKLI